jgi:hypothetical protein
MTTTIAAEALFASSLQPSDRPTAAQAIAAVRDSLQRHGGSHGCAVVSAAEYGAHPDTAPARMRWALTLAKQIRGPARLAA